jgi:predicted transcriptional regulator
MPSSKDREFDKEILACLSRSTFGLTISDIAKKIETTRNTVYRYLGILEGTDLVFKKKIGRYVLYFSKEKELEYLDNVLPIYKSFIDNIRKEFPDKEFIFKRIGKGMVDAITFPISIEGYEHVEKLKELPNKNLFELVRNLLPFLNLFDNKITVRIIDLNKEATKVEYQITNSIFLEGGESHLYHFQILAGFIEEKLKQVIEKIVKCEVLDYKIFEKKEDSYIRLSIEILE